MQRYVMTLHWLLHLLTNVYKAFIFYCSGIFVLNLNFFHLLAPLTIHIKFKPGIYS